MVAIRRMAVLGMADILHHMGLVLVVLRVRGVVGRALVREARRRMGLRLMVGVGIGECVLGVKSSA